jgi:hypothetical protein
MTHKTDLSDLDARSRAETWRRIDQKLADCQAWKLVAAVYAGIAIGILGGLILGKVAHWSTETLAGYFDISGPSQQVLHKAPEAELRWSEES